MVSRHLGGDEVNVGCFNASASVRRWVAAQGPGTTLQDVFVLFETKVHALAAKHGKHVQTWHDAFVATSKAGKTLPRGSIAQVWMATDLVNNATGGMASIRLACFSCFWCAVVHNSTGPLHRAILMVDL